MRRMALWVSLVLIFVIPWENMISIGMLGTVSRAAGLLVMAFWVFTVIVTGRFRSLHPFHFAIYLFIIWNAASLFWSLDADKTLARVLTYVQLFGLVVVLWDLYTTRAALRLGLQAYILGGYVSIASTVGNYISGSQFNPGRYGATGFNVNDLGMILALGVPVAWHLAVSEDGGRNLVLKIVNYAYIPAAILAIILSGSRTAVVATLPAFVLILGSFSRLKLYVRVLISAAFVAALIALPPLIPARSFQRLASTETELTTGDLNGRLEIWQDGIASFVEHPLLGIGSGAFAEITDTQKVGHNLAVSLLVEVGMIGFVLFMIILAIVFYEAGHQPKWRAGLSLAVLIVLLFGFATHNWEYKKQTWLFVSLVIAGANLPDRRDKFMSRSMFPHVGPITANWNSPTVADPSPVVLPIRAD